MRTQTADIKTESGTTVRTTRGRRRPVVNASPFAICPVCGAMDFADSIAAGACTGCVRRERQAIIDHERALADARRDDPANSELHPY